MSTYDSACALFSVSMVVFPRRCHIILAASSVCDSKGSKRHPSLPLPLLPLVTQEQIELTRVGDGVNQLKQIVVDMNEVPLGMLHRIDPPSHQPLPFRCLSYPPPSLFPIKIYSASSYKMPSWNPSQSNWQTIGRTWVRSTNGSRPRRGKGSGGEASGGTCSACCFWLAR